MRVYNFAAGPATLPTEVLLKAQSELLDFGGTGMSVMELSHRSKEFVAVAEGAEARLRELMGIGDDYTVLFLQGGATGQFAGIPLNLTPEGATASYVNTGSWSKKAIGEAKKYLNVEVIADEVDSNYSTTPAPEALVPAAGSSYLHYTVNETIGGVEFGYLPQVDVPLVADVSSTILSRPVDVSSFGVLYAGAQKNLGPAGLTVVIVRNDLLERARPQTPSMLDWTQMAGNGSMLNTPPTFGWYLLGLVLDWVAEQGGVSAMGERNRAKAEKLYGAIDDSDFYSNPVQVDARSWMNVPFLVADPELEKPFVQQAAQAGLTNLSGHRSVGGMRASIYNAMPIEGVEALVEFMAEFERNHG